jgi:hypothetical protein
MHVSLLCPHWAILKIRVTPSHVDTLKYGDMPFAPACRIIVRGEGAWCYPCE